MHLLASTVGQIFSPFFKALSWLLAFYYSLVPNYVFAIALLTVSVMIVSFPLNRASTRAMFKMQLFQPEVQKLRNKYKPSRDMPQAERHELRQKLNEETMALYRENNISMTGGCLPNLVIFPIFIVLYDVIRGLTNTCIAQIGQNVCATSAIAKSLKHSHVIWSPRYITHNTALYSNLSAAHGKMIAFGINLANTVRSPQHSWIDVLPFVAVVLVAIALQYIQLKQMTGRNTATGQGVQQMQAMQKFMPLIMALIYISIPAAVNIYFIVSSLFRIGQQEYMYRRDPQIVSSLAVLKARRSEAGTKPSGTGKSGGSKPAGAGSKPGTAGSKPALGPKQGGSGAKSGPTSGSKSTTSGSRPPGAPKTGSGGTGAANRDKGRASAGKNGTGESVTSPGPVAPRGLLGRLSGAFTAPQAGRRDDDVEVPSSELTNGSSRRNGNPAPKARPAGAAPTRNGSSSAKPPVQRAQPRAQGKRPRRPR